MGTTIYLIRHGEVENPKQVFYGRSDIPLTEGGRLQIRRLGEKIKNQGDYPKVIFSSPIKRALESANELKKIFPQAQLKVADNLQEVDLGKLQGMPLDFHKQVKDIYTDPKCQDMGIEKPMDIVLRMKGVIDQILKDYPGEVVFVISHGDPLAFFRFYLLTQEDPINNLDEALKNYLAKGEAWKVTFDIQNNPGEFLVVTG